MINLYFRKLHLRTIQTTSLDQERLKAWKWSKLKTSRFVLIALDRWTRMVSCLTAQKDDHPPAVVNDVPFLSTLLSFQTCHRLFVNIKSCHVWCPIFVHLKPHQSCVRCCCVLAMYVWYQFYNLKLFVASAYSLKNWSDCKLFAFSNIG